MPNPFLTIANPINKAVLRSPLHGLMSKSTMLISFKGRKSGKTYETPVNYHREGQTITVVSWKNRAWWKNLRGGVPVTVRVEGEDLTGTADVLPTSDADVAAGLRAMYPKLSESRIAKMAPDMVMIKIVLE